MGIMYHAGNSVSAMNHKASLGGTLVLEFVKGAHDNPKVCGFALVQGSESGLLPVILIASVTCF